MADHVVRRCEETQRDRKTIGDVPDAVMLSIMKRHNFRHRCFPLFDGLPHSPAELCLNIPVQLYWLSEVI